MVHQLLLLFSKQIKNLCDEEFFSQNFFLPQFVTPGAQSSEAWALLSRNYFLIRNPRPLYGELKNSSKKKWKRILFLCWSKHCLDLWSAGKINWEYDMQMLFTVCKLAAKVWSQTFNFIKFITCGSAQWSVHVSIKQNGRLCHRIHVCVWCSKNYFVNF